MAVTKTDKEKARQSRLKGFLTSYIGGNSSGREANLPDEVLDRRSMGYWKSFSNVKKELEKIVAEVGHFPTTGELKDRGYQGLVTALHDYHGGIREISERMGYTYTKKPQGYWKDKKNILKEVRRLGKKLGHFPSVSEMREQGCGSLYGAIKEQFGGMVNLRKHLGKKLIRKPTGFWKEWNNVEQELKKLVNKLGHFPTQKELSQNGYSSLTAAIGNHHGGLCAVREKMGYEHIQKAPGYWKDFSVIEQEMKQIIQERGYYPLQRELIEAGRKDLVAAIGKNHGGWSEVRTRLGYESPVKPKGYWEDWDNVEETIKRMIKELGHFPTYNDFKNSEYSTIPQAVKKFHGGMKKIMERMGYSQKGTPLGHWKKFSNVKKVLEDLETKLGHFPTQREIYESGYTGLPTALTSYFGGLNKVAERLGKTTQQRKRGYWSLKKVKDSCIEFIDKFGHFPSQKELTNREDNYRGLVGGANKHGGLDRIRRLVGADEDYRPNNYWDKKRVFSEVREIIREKGILPTQKQLNEIGKGDLVAAIGKYSSFTEIRRELGLEINKVGNNYWTEKKVLKECRKILEEQGDILTQSGLREIGFGMLASQIEKKGGYPYIRKKLGLSQRHKQKRFWDKDNTYKQADELYRKYGDLPSQEELKKLHLTTLTNAAREHFGGLPNLRRMLQESHGDVDYTEEKLKDLKYVQEQLNQIREEQDLKYFPGSQTLRKLGQSKLVYAITKYHGGFNKVRESMGERVVVANGTWENSDFVLEETRKLMKKHEWKSLPGEQTLRKLGYTMLPVAIRQCFGGMRKFRRFLGEDILRVESGQWKDENYVITEAKRAMDSLGYNELPPQQILYKNGFGGVARAISTYHGGFPVFRDLLKRMEGQPIESMQLEEMLTEYARAGGRNG